MSKPGSRSKSRLGIFSVGRNKANPARAASMKRASIRRSVLATDPSRIQHAFEDAGEAGVRTQSHRPTAAMDSGGSDAFTRDLSEVPGNDGPEDMKDTPLPPLPHESSSAQISRTSASRPSASSGSRQPRSPTSPTMAAPPRKSGPQRPPQHSATMPQPATAPQQTNLFKRFTSKFRNSPSPGKTPSKPDIRQIGAPQRKNTVLRMPKAPQPASTNNDFTSAEQRRAALRARGLIPPTSPITRQLRDAEGFMMPLSEQEAEIDKRFTVVVPGSSSSEEESESEAKKIREAWLSKQSEAAAPPSPPPRNSDAMERASKDGTIGEMNSKRATFISARTLSPNVGEIGEGGFSLPGSPLDATVEDFHTAPNTPVKSDENSRQSVDHARPTSPRTLLTPAKDRDAPTTPSSHSSAVTEKVSRWLRTSNDLTTSVQPSTTPATADVLHAEPLGSMHGAEQEDAGAPTPATVTPAGTVRPRKEKPPPIIVTSHRQSQDPKAPAQLITVALAAAAAAAPSDSEASTSTSDDRLSLDRDHSQESQDARGRAAATAATSDVSDSHLNSRDQHPSTPPRLAQSTSTRSRGTTVPALSPTRTVSSSGGSSTLPTPTTTSCVRDAPISRVSTSHPSVPDASAPRRSGASESRTGAKGKGKGPTVILEEYSETEPSSEGGEFGAQPAPSHSQPGTQAATAGARVQVTEQAGAKQQNRKSFSLFGKKSLDIPRDTRTASSMSNLRRAFTSGTKQRPKSTLDPAAVSEMGRKNSRMFDASHLPASPTFPPSSSEMAKALATGRTTGVGPRQARQAVAPTMHSRGSILLQAHHIEDEESRRLSEMAFLT